ncbi:hypothetical protein [Sphingomonas jatrophae]|uniref:Uncharacterized protein n=1 Tax=Sphingomonas jatrophae TaxID=1166337 RepID=A0A1I6KGE1_9SPHN|nr:hypothetical protein [Sphingomonas jatrophae]SFR90299.1 hypothetical protein SAMN05192580_1714 [Sphingomonas jatrophae]
MEHDILVIGTGAPETRGIADALEARMVTLEPGGAAGWRAALDPEPPAATVIVALFHPLHPPEPAVVLDPATWAARSDGPLLDWMVALGGAAALCADGGAILAVVDEVPALDAAGMAPEAGVAEGVAALVRSLALSEGKRGVRANTVSTPFRLMRKPPVLPPPPLAGFPGTFEGDVLESIRLLLSPHAAHFSGHVFPADRGRSW